MDSPTLDISLFFSILRSSLTAAELPENSSGDLAPVWKELQSHAIQNLAVDTLARLDPGQQMRYIQSAALSMSHWYKLMGTQQELFLALQQAHIPCAVLKGAAAAWYYPDPTRRNMGDIDLLVKPADFERAVQILIDCGCQVLDTRNSRHTEFQKNGIVVELHRHFATLSDHERANAVDQILFDALDRCQVVTLEGYAFPMLPPMENGLVLIEHINSHMETGLGFRQIIDWMLFVRKEVPDELWFSQLSGLLEQARLSTLALTVTRMCQIYLGLSEEITWCRFSGDALCRQLMEHTMQQGNFGRKLEKRTRGAANVLSALDSNKSFFHLLQKHGCYNWKALKKHPWLRPFAWLYQLLRYVRKSLRGKKALQFLRLGMRKKKAQGDLLKELGVQRKNHELSKRSMSTRNSKTGRPNE